MERPEARALWWPRFQRIAAWFAEWETARRGDVATHRRRDRRRDRDPRSTTSARLRSRRAPTASNVATTARYAILDYKTGQPPTGKQVRMGLSPQLTLEAAILREGGFAGIAAGARSASSLMSGSAATIRRANTKSLELKIKQSDTPQPPDDALPITRGASSKR